jgi:hypothetical protein
MPYLPQFDFDVFLSYGWAGREDSSSGDPAWVAEFHRRLLEELRGTSRHISIYYDRERSLAGDLLENMLNASGSSAVFVFVSAPDSERDASYCRDELRAFFDARHHYVGPAKDRTFVAQLRPFAPPPRPRPPEVDGIAAYRFLAGNTPYPKEHLGDPKMSAGIEFARLTRDILDKLISVRAALRGSTTYVASGSRQMESNVLRLRAEQNLANRFVLFPPGDIAQERAFIDDCANRIDASGLCVHVADKEFLIAPPGWKKSPQRIQLLDLALSRSASGVGPRVLLWIDPEAQSLDWKQFSTPWSDVVCNNTFEEFTSIVSGGFQAEPQSPSRHPTPRSKILYVHCLKEEIKGLKPLLDHAESKGIAIQLPYYDGTRVKREELIREALRDSNGSLVYFGKDHDINVGRSRDLINAVFAQSRPSAPRALLLDPGDDDYRRLYRAEYFEKIAQTVPVPPALDAFFDRVMVSP